MTMTKEKALKTLMLARNVIANDWKQPIGTPEALDMAIEALQAEPTHGRLIDADALLDKLPRVYYGSTVHLLINDAPTVSIDRSHGEWICIGDYAMCSECGGSSGTQYDGVERIPRITAFCPHCGVRMTKGGEDE